MLVCLVSGGIMGIFSRDAPSRYISIISCFCSLLFTQLFSLIHSIVFLNPSSSFVFGSYFRRCLASVISA